MTALPHLYLIFYEATVTEIIIHAIRHAARDPSEMPGTSQHIASMKSARSVARTQSAALKWRTASALQATS